MTIDAIALERLALTLSSEENTESTCIAPQTKSSSEEIEQLQNLLSQISSDSPRGDGSFPTGTDQGHWLMVIWAIASMKIEAGKEIARKWSMLSALFTEDGFESAWNSYNPLHERPITVGSIHKLAQHLNIQNDSAPDFEAKLRGWSSTGESEAMRKKMLEDKFVLEDVAILGQWTTFYASFGVGKTLLTLHLLKESIQAGNLDGQTVFYINVDDNYRGSIEKLALAEELGIEMLLPHRNGFNPENLIGEIKTAAINDQARNIIIVLDTMKKFVDLMNKTAGTEFGIIARGFVQAGGTLICLAHTNKHQDPEGKSVYSGTTDVADDSDCVFIIEKIKSDTDSGRHLVEFRNEKPRGNVAEQKTFAYHKQKSSSYEDILGSVEVIDPEVIEQEKQDALKQKQYMKDKPVIEIIKETAEDESLDLTSLVKRVNELSGLAVAKCREIVKRYQGKNWDQYTFWKITLGENNRKTVELLPYPFKT